MRQTNSPIAGSEVAFSTEITHDDTAVVLCVTTVSPLTHHALGRLVDWQTGRFSLVNPSERPSTGVTAAESQSRGFLGSHINIDTSSPTFFCPVAQKGTGVRSEDSIRIAVFADV